jgi:hypothetical protein
MKTKIEDTCIFVATNGHVWIAKEVWRGTEGEYHLVHARIIREWGTAEGLNQLVTGPTSNTKLDAPAGIVTVNAAAVLYRVPSSDAGWEKHLK